MAREKRLLKVLHVDPERSWGGGERQVLGLVSYLALRGHECHLLCAPDAPLSNEARKSGLTTLPIRIRNELDPRPVLGFRRLVQRERYEIIHFHTKRAHALSLWLGPSRGRFKTVVTRRMDYPIEKNWYHHYLYNRRTDGIIAISRKIAEVLVEGGVKKDKIRVIHSGIDPVLFPQKPQQPSDRPLVIGTVAVLVPRKGHRFLLEAAALLKQRGISLQYRFAGEGPERRSLEALTYQLGLDRDVEFMGFVSDVPRLLESIDIFVLPSLYEGLGVAVLEAMAAGKPVVASSVGGLPELVEDRVTGFVVPPGDSEALAQVLGRLVSSDGLLKEMGTKGREKVRQNFTVEQMAMKNEEFYYELLQSEFSIPETVA